MYLYSSSQRCCQTLTFLKAYFSLNSYRKRRGAPIQIIDFIGMKYVKKDDIIRMSQMYDCSCEVGTSRSIGCFTSIYLQTVVDFVIGSFNEFKCLRKNFFSCISKTSQLSMFKHSFLYVVFNFRYNYMYPRRLISVTFCETRWSQP